MIIRLARTISVLLLFISGPSFGSSVTLPETWEPAVIYAGFIGIVRCAGSSYVRDLEQSARGKYTKHTFVRCVVEESLKGSAQGKEIVLMIGPGERNEWGDKVPSARPNERYFVIAHCDPISPGGLTPPAPFDFSTGSQTWSPLPWSPKQTTNFMQWHGSKSGSLETYMNGVKSFLALSADEREAAVIRSMIRGAYVQLFQRPPTTEDMSFLDALQLSDLVKGLLAYFETRRVQWANFNVYSRPNLWSGAKTLAILKQIPQPHPLLSPELMAELERHVKYHASSCTNSDVP